MTFDKIEDEIKVARTTNRHGTENRFPYHLQNILSDFIYVNYGHLNFSKEQKKSLENYVNFVKKGVHTTFIDDTMVKQMLVKGLITEEEFKAW